MAATGTAIAAAALGVIVSYGCSGRRSEGPMPKPAGLRLEKRTIGLMGIAPAHAAQKRIIEEALRTELKSIGSSLVSSQGRYQAEVQLMVQVSTVWTERKVRKLSWWCCLGKERSKPDAARRRTGTYRTAGCRLSMQVSFTDQRGRRRAATWNAQRWVALSELADNLKLPPDEELMLEVARQAVRDGLGTRNAAQPRRDHRSRHFFRGDQGPRFANNQELPRQAIGLDGSPLDARTGVIEGSRLLRSLDNGDRAAVLKALGRGADADYYEEQESPLLLAIKRKDFGLVRQLVEAGADVNSFDGDLLDLTPVMAAAQVGQRQILEYLVASGGQAVSPKATRTDRPSSSPLIEGAEKGDPWVCRFLLAHKDDPNHQGGHEPLTALMRAALFGRVEYARCLLAGGADPNRTEDLYQRTPRRTALMHAVKNGSLEMVKLLVENGANPRLEAWVLKNDECMEDCDYSRDQVVAKFTALSLARKLKHREIATYLKQALARGVEKKKP